MFKFLGEILVIYLVYKIIFDLLIPAITITRKTKNMFDEMNRQHNQNQQNTSQTSSAKTVSQKHDDEYIDYEEVK